MGMNINLFGVGAVSAKVAVTSTASAALQLPRDGTSVSVVNRGPNPVYVQFGDETVAAVVPGASLVTAPTTSLTILNGQQRILERNPTVHRYVSFICEATETATVLVAVGFGSN